MGRVRTEDGKRVSIGLKVSEAKAKAVDAARGSTPRALWLESLIDAALAARPLEVGGVRITVTADARVPEGVIVGKGKDGPVAVRLPAAPAPDRVEEVRAMAQAAGAPLVPAGELDAPARRSKGNCKHSNMRIRKGICPDCDEWVTGKSLR